MNDIVIHVENLTKSYYLGEQKANYQTLRESFMSLIQKKRAKSSQPTKIWALKDVSFEIKRGEVLGIIGRNGAGKSTLLKIISRITRPTSGQVRLRGRVGSLLEVGTGFHPELTGRENIFLNGAILGMHKAEIERKYDEIVAFAEIEPFLDTPVKRYSSGMYMRLAFAVAAHLEPEILLVDEVLAVGDIAFQKKCLGKMGQVATSGRTVLFVSHNLAAVQQICTHGILLHEGQIRQQGAISQVVREYIGATATSSRRVEIKPADHVTGLNGLQVLNVTLLNSRGDGFSVPWRQDIHIMIDIQAFRPFQHVSFGLGIATLEGVPVMTVHDLDRSATPWAMEPGRYRVEVKLDNPLRLGIYNLILGAHEAVSKSSIYFIPNAVRLEVVNSTIGDDIYFEHNTGIINGNSLWQLAVVEESVV